MLTRKQPFSPPEWFRQAEFHPLRRLHSISLLYSGLCSHIEVVMTDRMYSLKKAQIDWRRPTALGILCFGLLAAFAVAAELKQDTIEAFERYVKITEENRAAKMRKTGAFLWIDNQQAEAVRQQFHERLARGEIITKRLETRDDNRPIPIPHGTVHHWVGTIFIPGATLPQTMTLMENYTSYPQLFSFGVQGSKVLSHETEDFQVQLRTFRKASSPIFYNVDLDDRYFHVDANHDYRRSRSTRIAELTEVGKPTEHELPVGNDRGLLWRLDLDWSCEEEKGGVFLQIELIALSRGVPAIFAWLANPYIESIPQEYLEKVLQAMRAGAAAQAPMPPSMLHPSRKPS
jgi:hypothetical protein